jgi:hypothetical protein
VQETSKNKNLFLYKKSKKRHLRFVDRFLRELKMKKSFANHVLCENVAIKRYRNMIATKSRNVIKMTKMTVSRNN